MGCLPINNAQNGIFELDFLPYHRQAKVSKDIDATWMENHERPSQVKGKKITWTI